MSESETQITEPVAIEPGSLVKFRDKLGDDEGIVNGAPWLYWETGDTLAVYVPVHVQARNANVLVRGENIIGASHA